MPRRPFSPRSWTKSHLHAFGVYGFFAANSRRRRRRDLGGRVARPRARAAPHSCASRSRQSATEPLLALSDFIAPVGSGVVDSIGAFAVTAGIGLAGARDEVRGRPRRLQRDPRRSPWPIAWSRRSRNASTSGARIEWGYGRDERPTLDDLLNERYRGIRPAPGYPACPDHTEKATLWRLLDVENAASIRLTENFAMHPAASVSGFYFAHPESRYFSVGKIGQRSGRGLRAPEGDAGRRGGAVAQAEPGLRDVRATPRCAHDLLVRCDRLEQLLQLSTVGIVLPPVRIAHRRSWIVGPSCGRPRQWDPPTLSAVEAGAPGEHRRDSRRSRTTPAGGINGRPASSSPQPWFRSDPQPSRTLPASVRLG